MEYCKNCNKDVEPDVEEQEFKNRTIHLRGSCPECGKYIKYLSWDEYRPGENPNEEIVGENSAEQGHRDLDKQLQRAIDLDTESRAESVWEKWQKDNGTL